MPECRTTERNDEDSMGVIFNYIDADPEISVILIVAAAVIAIRQMLQNRHFRQFGRKSTHQDRPGRVKKNVTIGS
jgi:hypothetical protein